MCGIVGFVAPKVSKRQKDYFAMLSSLLDADTTRGMDSTGVAVIPLDPALQRKVVKDIKPGFDFINEAEFKALEEQISTSPVLVIGHNRAATHGSVIRENAHPFEVDNITLVHNGVVTNKDDLDSGVVSDVDSHHIAGAIQKHGWAKAIPTLEGSAILVWHDAHDNTLHVTRTRHRDLSLAFDEDGTLWFASEGLMLQWAAKLHNITLVGKMLSPREWYHYSMSVNDPSNFTGTKLEEPKPKWKEEEDRWARRQQMYHRDGYKWGRHGQQGGREVLGEALTGPSSPSTSKNTTNDSTTHTETPTTEIKNLSLKPGLKAYVEYNAEKNSYVLIPREQAEKPGTHEPTSKKKRRRMAKQLEDWGYELGEKIDIKPYGYVVSKEHLGEIVISGIHTAGGLGFEVRVHNASRALWDNRDPFGNIRVVVTAMMSEISPAYKGNVLMAKPWIPTMSEIVFGPRRSLIGTDIYEEVAALGCYHCNGDILTQDHDRVQWTCGSQAPQWQMVCPACVYEHQVRHGQGLGRTH